jgi:hypothetical protein
MREWRIMGKLKSQTVCLDAPGRASSLGLDRRAVFGMRIQVWVNFMGSKKFVYRY